MFRNCDLRSGLCVSNMCIRTANAKENRGELIRVSITKAKARRISRSSFVLISMRFVGIARGQASSIASQLEVLSKVAFFVSWISQPLEFP